jgi:hydroxyethylthiazole kinase
MKEGREANLLETVSMAVPNIRKNRPLIHHITNYVTANDCANIVLAAGGSPVMADDPEEVEEMVSLAGCLVINIGTLDTRTVEAMLRAGARARERGAPIVLDPVGAGATGMRTRTAERIIRELSPEVIRGNLSEIRTLAGSAERTLGVDSTADASQAEEVAGRLSRELGCIVAVTGRIDVVAGGGRLSLIRNGDEMLSRITGGGCMCSSLVGTFCAVMPDRFAGAAAGILVMGVAGEIARERLLPGEGTGSYRFRIIDAVSRMSAETILARGRVS